jgi:hypothetical protein
MIALADEVPPSVAQKGEAAGLSHLMCCGGSLIPNIALLSVKELQQGVRIDRLDEMVVEPRCFSLPSVLRVAPPGNGNEYDVAAPALSAYPSGDFISIPGFR